MIRLLVGSRLESWERRLEAWFYNFSQLHRNEATGELRWFATRTFECESLLRIIPVREFAVCSVYMLSGARPNKTSGITAECGAANLRSDLFAVCSATSADRNLFSLSPYRYLVHVFQFHDSESLLVENTYLICIGLYRRPTALLHRIPSYRRWFT